MNIGSTHQSQPSAAWPGLTNDLNATRPGWARSAFTQSCGVSFSAERDPLGGLSVPYDWRIMIS